ncbi:hypothetical protein PanWU01x14_084000 [Parasponia andersonii]|uniref:Uncharacterized protein n=1 Tax=Parasponia andersonii TaxID=3476 RepID=A0A2P5D9J0_PARAD|nr:hypothetical protein PanWU01x14_084000 [Parasponia andersonii]
MPSVFIVGHEVWPCDGGARVPVLVVPYVAFLGEVVSENSFFHAGPADTCSPLGYLWGEPLLIVHDTWNDTSSSRQSESFSTSQRQDEDGLE